MSKELRQVTAGEAMNENVRWAQPRDLLRAAGESMVQNGIRALLVRSERDQDLPGILSSKDIVNMVGAHGSDVLDELHVEDACTRPAICVPEHVNLLDCVNLMRMSGVRRLPVLRGPEVVGILSLSDVFARLLR